MKGREGVATKWEESGLDIKLCNRGEDCPFENGRWEGVAVKWEESGLDIKLCNRGEDCPSKWEEKQEG
jgi:hypothetical protein